MTISTHGRILGVMVVVAGCTAEPAGGEGGGGSSSGASTSTTDGPITAAEPGGTTTSATAADVDTGGSSTAGSSGDEADSGPGVSLDLGVIPDMPEGGCEQGVDIVFTMDVSTTMGGFIQILADEILAVDAAIMALDLPLQPHYGLAVFVDDAVLLNGGAPYANATALRDDFLMWSAFTASNQQVGGGNSNSTWTENSIDALYFAADEFQWRPAESTVRMVIHTTDDTFWDGPTIGNGVMIQHGYAETVQRLQDQFVRTYAFADDIGGSCGCQDVTPGWSSPYMGMFSIPVATDGGVFDIADVLAGTVSLSDALTVAVEESICDPYSPQG